MAENRGRIAAASGTELATIVPSGPSIHPQRDSAAGVLAAIGKLRGGRRRANSQPDELKGWAEARGVGVPFLFLGAGSSSVGSELPSRRRNVVKYRVPPSGASHRHSNSQPPRTDRTRTTP